MKSYVKPNIVVDFLDIETYSSIGEVVLQLSPVQGSRNRGGQGDLGPHNLSTMGPWTPMKT